MISENEIDGEAFFLFEEKDMSELIPGKKGPVKKLMLMIRKEKVSSVYFLKEMSALSFAKLWRIFGYM